MATSIDQKNFVKTALRLPPELHAAVHESAQKNGRSYNAELVDRVQQSFKDDDGDRQQQMIFEMRRTQLHLELNSIRREQGHLFEESQDCRVMLRESADPATHARMTHQLQSISNRQDDLNRRSSEILEELSAVDQKLHRHIPTKP